MALQQSPTTIMNLQERRNLARLASEFDDRLRVLCDVFCNTSMPTKPSTAANVTTATAATGANTPIEHQLNPEPTGASGNPSTGVEGDSGGSEQPAKRRRRPPAKHEGFCTSDAAALGSEAPEAGPVEASTGKGSIAESKGKSQGPQVLPLVPTQKPAQAGVPRYPASSTGAMNATVAPMVTSFTICTVTSQ